MHNNSARRCADRAVNRGRRSNVWGTGGRATASGQQSLSATAGFSQTRAPREQQPGVPAHTAEGVRAHGLAGGVGVLPRVAAQDAVDAGEAVTPDARGQADDGRAGVADGCQPGSQAARRDAALGRVVVEQGADRVQEAGMLRRSQREGRGRARPRLGEDAASEDATVGEQVTQIMDGVAAAGVKSRWPFLQPVQA